MGSMCSWLAGASGPHILLHASSLNNLEPLQPKAGQVCQAESPSAQSHLAYIQILHDRLVQQTSLLEACRQAAQVHGAQCCCLILSMTVHGEEDNRLLEIIALYMLTSDHSTCYCAPVESMR